MIRLAGTVRPQGVYIAGNPGYGKTSLIQRMALDDIEQDRGVCVIDVSGELISNPKGTDALIDWIPKHRIVDTIYFNTSDCTKSIDIFSYHNDPQERRVLLDELVALFKLDTAPRAKPMLHKIISIIFDANEQGGSYTFLDIQSFIEDEKKRDKILRTAKRSWSNFKSTDLETVTTRIIPFAEDSALRAIVSSPRPVINLWDVMQENKILLVDLQDTDTDYLIGSIIVAKIQQAIFRRREIYKLDRTPFHLYVDEFNTILAHSGNHFEKILNRARKYKLCLTLANPYPDDLSSEIFRKLPGIGTKILFNLDPSNARLFKDQIVPFPIETLTTLPKFTAICKAPGEQAITIPTPSFLTPNSATYAKYLRKRTVDKPAGNDTENMVQSKDDVHTADHNTDPQNLLPHRPKKARP
jgi:hypothetical protein